MRKLAFLIVLLLAISMFGCAKEAAIVEKTDEKAASAPKTITDFLSMKEGKQYTSTLELAKGGIKSTVTHYYGGSPTRFRMDLASSRVYILPEGAFVCSRQGGKWACLGMSADQQKQDPGAFFSGIEKNIGKYTIEDVGTMSVTETIAQCYLITADVGKVKECFASNGIPLYLSSIAGDGKIIFEMKATTFREGAIADSEFVLPAEVIGIKDIVQENALNNMTLTKA